VCDAVQRYGTQFSSSRSYVSAPAYAELEALLEDVFGRPVVVAPTTSLGHLAALPVLVGSSDAVLIDAHVHHSVQVAAAQLRAEGVRSELVWHNRLDLAQERIEELARTHRRVWYLADGVYSMSGEVAPLDGFAQLLDRHEALHLYIDDSHGVGWSGTHGRGPALERLGAHDRVVAALSLNKSFAAAGGAIAVADREQQRLIRTCGGPMIFSGPIQPPMLGAALASARIHLSEELEDRQLALAERMELCDELMGDAGFRRGARPLTPIRTVQIGAPQVAERAAAALLERGFLASLATYPAVARNRCGLRVSITLHQTEADIRSLVDALDEVVPLDARATTRALEPVARAA
jgi:7-keto-8-aminopelargonate synthetase-like enzyme